jgi:hypothetical protein
MPSPNNRAAFFNTPQ